jgi:hypothetical protein
MNTYNPYLKFGPSSVDAELGRQRRPGTHPLSALPPSSFSGNTGIVPPELGRVMRRGSTHPLAGPGPAYGAVPTGEGDGGGQTPAPGTTMHTGGNDPAYPIPGANRPPPIPPVPGTTPPPGSVPPQQPQSSFAAGDVVNQILNGFLDGPYAADARRRGMEQANARGMLNSSMSAGASERAALESVSPFVQQAMGLINQRENNAASFYQQMSMIPMQSASDLTRLMAQYALDNPDVYTPNNLAGLSQFFNNNLQQIMSQYFGGG